MKVVELPSITNYLVYSVEISSKDDKKSLWIKYESGNIDNVSIIVSDTPFDRYNPMSSKTLKLRKGSDYNILYINPNEKKTTYLYIPVNQFSDGTYVLKLYEVEHYISVPPEQLIDQGYGEYVVDIYEINIDISDSNNGGSSNIIPYKPSNFGKVVLGALLLIGIYFVYRGLR